jgi:hypothetical protein
MGDGQTMFFYEPASGGLVRNLKSGGSKGAQLPGYLFKGSQTIEVAGGYAEHFAVPEAPEDGENGIIAGFFADGFTKRRKHFFFRPGYFDQVFGEKAFEMSRIATQNGGKKRGRTADGQ